MLAGLEAAEGSTIAPRGFRANLPRRDEVVGGLLDGARVTLVPRTSKIAIIRIFFATIRLVEATFWEKNWVENCILVTSWSAK